jgi:hypothetical protein
VHLRNQSQRIQEPGAGLSANYYKIVYLEAIREVRMRNSQADGAKLNCRILHIRCTLQAFGPQSSDRSRKR